MSDSVARSHCYCRTLTIRHRELFGPLLSVVPVDDLEAAIAFINSMYSYFVYLYIVVNAYLWFQG